MVVKRREPNGDRVLVRKAFDPDDYKVPNEFLDTLRTLRGYSIRELLSMRDEPLGSNLWAEKVERDGKIWWRLVHMEHEWGVLIEDSGGRVEFSETVPLTADEARAVSRSVDARRGLCVVDEPGA